MDQFLRGLIYKKIKMNNVEFTILDIIFMLGITISGIMIRISLKSVVTGDYTYFLEPWLNELKAGGIGALRGDFYNYNPPYMVILYLINVSGINTLTGIKAISCLFDILSAVVVGMIVMDITKSRVRTMFAYAGAWLLPTIVANSSLWGQCDAIYSSFVLLSIYSIIKEKPCKAMIFFGIAVGFKMQAIFIFPVFVILWAKRRIKLVHFLNIPIIYFISLMPAVLVGKSIASTMGIYMTQAKEQLYLEMNWPGVYELIGIEPYYDYYGPAAMWFTIGIVMCIMFFFAYKIYKVDKKHILELFLYIAMVTVYFLPYMHERYGYVAGVLAIIVGMINVKKLYIPIVHVVVSYGAYQSCMSDNRTVPFWILSFMLLFLILDFGIYLYKYVNENSIKVKEA